MKKSVVLFIALQLVSLVGCAKSQTESGLSNDAFLKKAGLEAVSSDDQNLKNNHIDTTDSDDNNSRIGLYDMNIDPTNEAALQASSNELTPVHISVKGEKRNFFMRPIAYLGNKLYAFFYGAPQSEPINKTKALGIDVTDDDSIGLHAMGIDD